MEGEKEEKVETKKEKKIDGKGILNVNIVEGRNFQEPRDYFCIISMEDAQFLTIIPSNKTTTPKWNQKFSFNILNSTIGLSIELYDRKSYRKKSLTLGSTRKNSLNWKQKRNKETNYFLADLIIPITLFENSHRIEKWFPLRSSKSKYEGEVYLIAEFIPSLAPISRSKSHNDFVSLKTSSEFSTISTMTSLVRSISRTKINFPHPNEIPKLERLSKTLKEQTSFLILEREGMIEKVGETVYETKPYILLSSLIEFMEQKIQDIQKIHKPLEEAVPTTSLISSIREGESEVIKTMIKYMGSTYESKREKAATLFEAIVREEGDLKTKFNLENFKHLYQKFLRNWEKFSELSQHRIIWALCELSQNKERRKIIWELGVIPFIQLLSTTSSLAIQELCLWFLSYPDKEILNNRQSGELIAVMKLLSTENQNLLLPILKSLINFSQSDSRRDTLISLGIINTLVSLLILDNEKDVKVHALWVLGNLSCSEKAQELICQSGILPFLITSFSSNEDDLVYRGILCFANLLLSEKNKEKILNDAEKIFPLLLKNLSSNNELIQIESLRSLSHFATLKKIRTLSQTFQVTEKLNSLLVSENNRIQEELFWLFAQLNIDSQNSLETWEKLESSILSNLKNHSSDESLIVAVLWSMITLLHDETVKNHVQNNGIKTILQELQNSENINIATATAKVLTFF